MTAVSLGLVLVAALLHATWNLFAKRAGSGGPEFVWLVATAAAVVYAPVVVAVVLITRPEFTWTTLGFVVGSGSLHICYFTLLQRGYRESDLSLVYPVARGTGPMLSATAAVIFLHERPGVLGFAGAALICLGVLELARTPSSAERTRNGIVFGLVTGLLIAAYTLWDRQAVAAFAIPPLVLDYGSNIVRSTFLAPLAAKRRVRTREVWSRHRLDVFAVAILSPLAYILVLTALTLSPVSYVAPAREVSVLIGTLLGASVLKEGHIRRRGTAALAVVAGLVLLSLPSG